LVNAPHTAFAVNWALTSSWLRVTRRRVGSPADFEIGSPIYLTTVARLPTEISAALADAASRLAGPGSGHYLYPPETIHLTVASLADLPGPEPMVEAALEGEEPFEVEVRGLNLALDSVFAELYPRGPGLESVRRRLREGESREHGPAARWLRRRLAHANLVRLGGPVEPRLIAEVRRLRRARFGSFEVAAVELARTDKVLSGAGTRPLGSFRLG
jgi:2'-5' RNA ligase